MIINNLPELYDSTLFVTARRECWPEGVCVFGQNARIIENKDIADTLVFDPWIGILLEGKPLTLCKALFIKDKEGRIRPWFPNQEEIHADDWIMEDKTQLVKFKMDEFMKQ